MDNSQSSWSGITFGEYFCYRYKNAKHHPQENKYGFATACALLVGAMIGGGIFICPGRILELTGSANLSLIVWYLSGMISLCGALSYAELNSIFSKSTGEHGFFLAIFRPMHKSFGSLPAFLFQWISLFVIRPTTLAINALSVSEYVTKLTNSGGNFSQSAAILSAVVFMIFLVLLNCRAQDASAQTQTIFAILKICLLSVIVIGGLFGPHKTVNVFADGFKGATSSLSLVSLAFYHGLLTYNGWNSLSYCTDMLENPMHTLLSAAMASITFVTILLVLVNISFFVVLTPDIIISSHSVIMEWTNAVVPSLLLFAPLGVILIITSAANGTTFVTTRLYIASAREGHLPSIFGMVHRNTEAPIPALLFIFCSTFLYIFYCDISFLIELSVFSSWLFYGLTFLSLLILRWKNPNSQHPLKNPIFIPIIAFLSSLFLISLPIKECPEIALFCSIAISFGIIFYATFVVATYRCSNFNMIILWLQHHCNLVNEFSPHENSSNVDSHEVTIVNTKPKKA